MRLAVEVDQHYPAAYQGDAGQRPRVSCQRRKLTPIKVIPTVPIPNQR